MELLDLDLEAPNFDYFDCGIYPRHYAIKYARTHARTHAREHTHSYTPLKSRTRLT